MSYSRLKEKIIDNHYTPLPLHGKIPAVKGFTKNTYVPPSGHEKNNVGIVCGVGDYPISAVDIDILDEGLAEKIKDYVIKLCGETLIRVGKPPKMMLIYQAERKGIRKKQTKQITLGKVEVLGYGQQFAAIGIHPETEQPYRWLGQSLVEVAAEQLPIITEAQINTIINYSSNILNISPDEQEVLSDRDYDPDNPLYEKLPHEDITTEDIKVMVNMLDPDSNRDYWRNVGMALHHQYGGSYEGFQIWDAWSAKGVKYVDNETEYQWESFGNFRGEPITIAFVRKEAKAQMEKVEELTVEPDFFDKIEWSINRFVENPEPVPMVIEDFLPKGIVGLFYSMGGVGKSTLLLDQAIRIALANEYETYFFGFSVNKGSVVFLTAEDPELILNHRINNVMDAIADSMVMTRAELKAIVEQHLFIPSTFGEDISLFAFDASGRLKPTKYYKSFIRNLKAIDNLSLVLIDTKTRFSPGEGNGNVVAAKEITYYEQITKETGASVILLHHTNKQGRNGSTNGEQAYRDATATWDNTRASWYLRPLTEEELLNENLDFKDRFKYTLLENSKNNYIPKHGNFIIERNGFAFSHWEQSPKPTKLEEEASKNDADYMALLRFIQEGNEGLSKTELIRKSPLGRVRGERALHRLETNALVETQRLNGNIILYKLTDEGKMFGLNIFD